MGPIGILTTVAIAFVLIVILVAVLAKMDQIEKQNSKVVDLGLRQATLENLYRSIEHLLEVSRALSRMRVTGLQEFQNRIDEEIIRCQVYIDWVETLPPTEKLYFLHEEYYEAIVKERNKDEKIWREAMNESILRFTTAPNIL